MPRLVPGTAAPALRLDLVGGDSFNLATAQIDRFLLIDVYRGLHCPRCHRHVLDLNSKLPALGRRGVSVLAASMDTKARAAEAQQKWGATDVPFAYGMTTDDAMAWDLFVSSSISEREPGTLFAEPATFLIRPDHSVYSAIYNSTPFNRFSFADMLEALDVIAFRDYPPRGTVDLRKSSG